MKRLTTLILAITLIAFTASSCQKDGQFKPSKKIASSIVERMDIEGNMKVVRTISYKWEKNLLVEEVNDNGVNIITSRFTYDKKKRISEINTSNNIKLVYTYLGDKITNIKEYYDGELAKTYFFEYDMNYITGIDVVIPEYKSAKVYADCPVDPLFFLPEKITDDIQTSMLKSQYVSQSYTFSYDIFDNLEKMQNKNIIYNYSYDNKRNPIYGFLDILAIDFDWILSQHNITKKLVTNQRDPDYFDVAIFEYTYSGNYPLTQTVKDINGAIVEKTTFIYLK